jgi:hypothetical protein
MTVANIHRLWNEAMILFCLGILKPEKKDDFMDLFSELGQDLYEEVTGEKANIESEPLKIDTQLTPTAIGRLQYLQTWIRN